MEMRERGKQTAEPALPLPTHSKPLFIYDHRRHLSLARDLSFLASKCAPGSDPLGCLGGGVPSGKRRGRGPAFGSSRQAGSGNAEAMAVEMICGRLGVGPHALGLLEAGSSSAPLTDTARGRAARLVVRLRWTTHLHRLRTPERGWPVASAAQRAGEQARPE